MALWESDVDDSGAGVMFSQLYKPLPVTQADSDPPAGAYSPGRACGNRADTHKHVACTK